jgi:hypothetical protein
VVDIIKKWRDIHRPLEAQRREEITLLEEIFDVFTREVVLKCYIED